MATNQAHRLRRLEVTAMATAQPPPRLFVLYEDDDMPLDWKETDLVIRVVYAPALPEDNAVC